MFSRCFASIGILLILPIVAVAGESPSPFADKPCLSYSSFKDRELRWGDAPVNDFGPAQVVFDQSGIRALRPAPPPGIHPRILCSVADLPEIRERLKNTKCGQQIWRNILCWTEGMKGTFNDKAEYAKPDVLNGSFGGLHGPVPLFRLGQGGWKSDRYSRLINGDTNAEVGMFWNVFALEAFRCWVEDDKESAEKLGKAVSTALKAELKLIDNNPKKKKDARPRALALDDISKGNGLAFTYDFLFNYLSPEQRSAIHDELAASTWYHDNYGTFNDATNCRSNWASFSYWLIQLLAIEGEPGFNDIKYLGLYRGWRNFLTYAYYPSGAVLEGEAKDQLGMDGIIAFAMRGTKDNLAGHPNLRAHATHFLPLSVTPTSGGKGPFGAAPFLKFDLLGGIGSIHPVDALGLKYLFPEDKVIDWVFRKEVGENYERVPDRPDGYFNAVLFWGIFATDFHPDNSNPSKLDVDHTFFCGERSLLITRSDWTNEATLLGFHVRSAKGGHPYADRNSISICGAGRAWSTPGTFDSFENTENSVVIVDGKSQDFWVPGRMVDFKDDPLATFATGDAKYAWDWKWKTLEGKDKPYTKADVDAGLVNIPSGWQKVEHTLNDFAYTKRQDSSFNRPMFELPSWIGVAGSITPVVAQPNYPVQKAFRTAGLVRGKHPYVLVVDDIQKDENTHRYEWILTLEHDLQMVQSTSSVPTGFTDVLLVGAPETAIKKDQSLAAERTEEAVPTGTPMLLVRILQCNMKGDTLLKPLIDEIKSKKNSTRRLVLTAESIAPNYKVLLFPHRKGDPLPQTSWNAAHTEVSITWPDQGDSIAFTESSSGKTNVLLSRGGPVGQKTSINLNSDISTMLGP